MCNNCYHSNGRNKKAWKCSHTQKPHYALGVCQTCYQSKYSSKAKKSLEEIKSHSSHDSDLDAEEKDPFVEANENLNNNENVVFEKKEKENKIEI